MKRTVTLALLLACGAAWAANWLAIGMSQDNINVYVDTSSIRVEGQIRRAWFKFVYAHHTFKGVGPNSQDWLSEAVGREKFNCSEESNRTEALTNYFDDGTSTTVPSELFPTPWEPVVPGTLQDVEMKFICAWGKK